VPNSSKAALELLQALAKNLTEGKHVAVHCRMGIGRSALVAAGLLVITGYLPSEAFELIEQARGRPVPDTEAQRQWVEDFRIEFLRKATA
jgi:protein-tyrosine phosphatase